MSPFATRNRTFAAAVALLAIAVASCDTIPGEPGSSVLSRAEADALAQVIATDLEGLPEAAAYDPAGEIPFGAAPATSSTAECVTRSPDPVVNSDDDPVPDSVRLTYTACVFSRPTVTVELNGIVDVLDLNPAVTDHAIRWVLRDFTRTVTFLMGGGTTTTVENGTRLVSATSSVLQHQLIDFTSEVTFPNGSTGLHEKDWATTFTADVAGSIAPRQRLPSGTWQIDGTSAWTHGDRGSSLDVSTEVPLHYNAECTAAPKFDAGTLVIVMSRGDRTATVTIQYTACGQYTVTRS
ncbi:MAG TPA: hypothetical protein VGA20_03715 [Gemmatimonadales bacterium]